MRYLLIISFLLFFATNAVAVPSVSGVSGSLVNAGSITVTGSSFGSNGPSVEIYDDYEGGSNGNQISTTADSATIGEWDATTYTVIYSNDFAHSGSLAHKTDWSSDSKVEGGRLTKLTYSSATDVFFSYWTYIPSGDKVAGYGEVGGTNWKSHWLYAAGHLYDTEYLDVILTNDFSSYYSMYGGTDMITGSYVGTDQAKGEWIRKWQYIHGHASTGIIRSWEMGPSHAVSNLIDKSGDTLYSGASYWDTWTMPGYGRGTDANSRLYYDDVYFATGTGAQARVEITDNATYLNSTNSTLCVPTAWAAGEVTCTYYEGSFTTGTAYLFVFDEDGNANAIGYEVTVGNSVTLTGTAIAGGVTETEIAAGAETLIMTVAGDTWVADVCSADRLLTACDGSLSGAGSWDTEIEWATVDCSRDSDTQVTLDIKASGYDISQNETITCTAPAAALTTSSSPIVATPTLSVISYVAAGTKTAPTATYSATGAAATYSATGVVVQ